MAPGDDGGVPSKLPVNDAHLIAAELPPYRGISFAEVTLVSTALLAREALDVLMAADAIGFDTESKPTFLKGEESTGPHLVQLAIETRAYLFQIPSLHGATELKEILESPKVLKVGMGLGHDGLVLQSKLGINIANVLDLGESLRGPWHRGTVGAKAAVLHFFGQRFQKSKRTGTSNWATLPLTERQLLYAADDAQVALRIYRASQRQQMSSLRTK